MLQKHSGKDSVVVSDINIQSNNCTVRPRGTRPHGTRTSLGHDFKNGSQILEISDFETQTSLGQDFKKGSKIFEISDFGTQTSLGHDFFKI